MQCPFLRKMNVKFCGLKPATRIPLSGTNLAAEQCSGPDYVNCPLVQERHAEVPARDHCPFLSVGDAHYCEAAPFQKLISCNQTTISRCTDGGHKYCRLYLGMTDTKPEAHISMDEIPMPEPLAFAPNHLWLDQGDGRTCHVGVDAFFGFALGRVDEVIYLQRGDNRRPMVRFRVDGVDFDLVFPNVMRGTEINAHLVSDPSEVLNDPYGRGWLFEGVTLPAPNAAVLPPLEKGLLRGESARRWMAEEYDRLARFSHDHPQENCEKAGVLQQDGGQSNGRLVKVLGRRTLVRLHSEFFNLRTERMGS